ALGNTFYGVVAKAGKQIRTIRYLGSIGSVARTIKPTQDGNGSTAGHSENPVDLPASKDFSSSSGHVPCERQIIGVVQGEVVADVNAREAPVGPPIVRVLWHRTADIEIPTEDAVRIVGVLGICV